jgi:mRNA-degrading endonuclease YafQ of YafQ-DinJ toxin-antitoxin module
MIEIVPTSAFRKAFKRKVRGNKALETRFRTRIAVFQENPFDPRLKTHRLSGQLQGLWSFSVDYDVRVVFSFIEPNRALFVDIGSHEEVY